MCIIEQVEIIKFTQKKMAARRKGFDYLRSSQDHSLYSFLYFLPPNQPLPLFDFSFHTHQLLRKEETVGTATNDKGGKEELKMPFSAVVVSQCEIGKGLHNTGRV